MRKWIILGVVLLVLAGAVGIAIANLNSYLNKNKDWLAGQVEQALGRKVSFDEVGVSILGGIGARVKNLRVADDAAFAKEDFVRAGDVQVSVRLLPALFGRYEVRRILLDKPAVTIIHEKNGFNFDSIGKGKKGGEKPGEPAAKEQPEKASEPAPAAPGGSPAAFLVALMSIRGGELRYFDRATSPPGEFAVRDLDFSASDLSLTTQIGIRVTAAVFGSEKTNLKLDGTIGPVGSPPDVQKAPLDLALEFGPVVIDNMKKLEAVAQLLPPELSSPDPIVLKAKVKGTPDRIAVETQLDGSGAAVRYGQAFTKPKGVPLRFDLAAERSGATLDVKNLALRLAELNLAGKGTVAAGPGGALDFQIDSKPTPLSGWDRLLPAFAGHDVSGTVEVHLRARGKTGGGEAPELTGTVALENVNAKQKGSPYEVEGLSTKLDLKGDSAILPPTRFKLGGSPVELEANVESFRSRAASFVLKSPELRAASLGFASPAAKKEEVVRGLEARGKLRVAENGPLFRGTLASSEGSLRDVDYRDLAADLGLENRVATLEKLALRAFDGTYGGSGRYDLREGDNPKFNFQSAVRGMVLKGLLGTKFPGAEQKIEGRLDADLALGGSGKGWDAVQKTLRGNGRVDVKNGVLKDVNLAEQVLGGVTGIGGLSNLVSPRIRNKYPEIFSTGDTKFDKLGGTVQIGDGAARTDDLTLAARDYSILGKGTFELQNQLDFTATLVASRQLSEDVVSDVKEAKYIANDDGRLEIPFHLAGALPKVRPKPDTEFIAKALARAAVGKGIDKLLGGKKKSEGGAPQRTPRPEEELLRKGLEGLFGR